MGKHSEHAHIINTLKTVLGGVCCILMVFFLILSIPVFVYRQVVILLAKRYRPDLGDIVNAQTAYILSDYDFSAKSSPRSNIVAPLYFQGHVSCDEVKQRVMNNWFSFGDGSREKLEYKKFQQYPVRWLGFTFWKDASSTFSVDNHVHKFSGMETKVTDEQLAELVEVLLNERLPTGQSPWEMHVIENFVDVSGKSNSVLIVKFHHCLMDGFGIMEAIAGGLCGQSWKKMLPAPRPSFTLRQKIIRTLTFPFVAFKEFSYIFSQAFQSSTFKIPDERKHWHQLVVKSGPIPIQLIKDIKNAFKVGFASVILSAFSAAIHKTLVNMHEVNDECPMEKSVFCASVLPAVGIKRRKILANHATVALFDLPTTKFGNPVERLVTIDGKLESLKMSVTPMVTQWYATIVGSHLQTVCGWISKNRLIAVGQSNFAVSSQPIFWDSTKKCVRIECIAGGCEGDSGMGFTQVSQEKEIGIFLVFEKALMTKEKAQVFMEYLKEEIEALRLLMPKEKMY